MFSITPLPFDTPLQGNPVNIRINVIHVLPETSQLATSSLLKVLVYLHSNFRGGVQKRMFWNRLHNGPSRSSKAVDFVTNWKRVCDFLSSYWSSIVTLVLSCAVSEILQVFCWEKRTLFQPNLGCVLLGLDCDVLAPGSEDPKLITRVIDFELVQPLCLRYNNVTDRRTDDLRQQYCASTTCIAR